MNQPTALDPRLDLGHGMWEEAVSFTVGEHALRGNLTGGGKGELGVLFLHGWGGVRSGPHELITAFARAIAADGVPSLRFDFRGRGESALEPGDISLGHMGDDAVAAARFLQRRAGVTKVCMVGICSGGNVAIGVLNRVPAVAGLFLLSVYPFGDGDSFSRDARRTAHFLKEYWRKLWLPATWRKLVRGEIFFREIARVLFGHHRKTAADDSAPAARRSPLENLLGTDCPVRMIYGEGDPDFAASHQYFSTFADERRRPIDFLTIPHANHNFYSLAWKQQLIDELRTMLRNLTATG